MPPIVSPDVIAPRERFGRYEILALLGRGGMGDVYRARDTVLGRIVALKLLRAGADYERILREARAAAAITHANVVSVFDVGEHEGRPYLAMELVNGRTLRSRIAAGDATLAERLAWLAAVAEALAAAHARGLLHRDVKPENVIVRDDGAVKVVDFGIARPDASAAVEAALTGETAAAPASARIAGTYCYMAPEQLRAESLDGRADQFAWGVTAFELLSGQKPWSEESAVHLGSRTLAYDPPALRAIAPEVPEGVESVVMKALAREREGRFASMEGLGAEFARAGAAVMGEGAGTVELPRGGEGRVSPAAVTGAALTSRGGGSDTAGRAVAKAKGWAIAVAGALIVAVAVTAVARGKGIRGAKTVSASSAPASVHSAVAHGRTPDEAPPAQSLMSANAEATAAYQAGLQAVRDASREAGLKNLERATEIDPQFAAAHLRIVATVSSADDDIREHARAALASRANLSAHDRTLLDAYLHWTQVPQDAQAGGRVLVDALEQAGDNADFAFHLCRLRLFQGDYRGAIEACERAVRLDETLADALRFKALGLLLLDDVPAARAVYERCLAVSPAATSCLRDLVELEFGARRCDAVVDLARRFIALDPGSALGYRSLEYGLFGVGAPLESVRAALEQSVQRRSSARRPIYDTSDRAHLAIAIGDFGEGEVQLRRYVSALETSADGRLHLEAANLLVNLYIEQGRVAEAQKVVDAYAQQRVAWTPLEHFDGGLVIAIWNYRLGRIARPAFRSLRDEWLAREAEQPHAAGLSGNARGFQWILAYAEPALTAQDAEEALLVLPDYQPLPPAFDRGEADAAIGRTYLLGGNPLEASRFLRGAASRCTPVAFPFTATQASYDLGAALEALGERRGACGAYGSVLERWPLATTKSRTASAAVRARSRLSCEEVR